MKENTIGRTRDGEKKENQKGNEEPQNGKLRKVESSFLLQMYFEVLGTISRENCEKFCNRVRRSTVGGSLRV